MGGIWLRAFKLTLVVRLKSSKNTLTYVFFIVISFLKIRGIFSTPINATAVEYVFVMVFLSKASLVQRKEVEVKAEGIRL